MARPIGASCWSRSGEPVCRFPLFRPPSLPGSHHGRLGLVRPGGPALARVRNPRHARDSVQRSRELRRLVPVHHTRRTGPWRTSRADHATAFIPRLLARRRLRSLSVGRRFGLFAGPGPRTAARPLFWLALFLALLPLVGAKSLAVVEPDHTFGFLGVSYVTFRCLDVIILIQDRLISSLAPFQYLAYLLFFPTISSGPIDRYRRFETDWKRRRTRAEFFQDLDAAVHRVFTGFLYKFLIAALLKRHWMDPAAASHGPLAIILYMYSYTFYLFFDFAGYSAFAIGVSYLFGIHTPENFDRPFLARNIRDFWNRWHISLSTWFRDHVYMRFVLAATKGRWFKGRYTASTWAFFLAFGLMGVWHGLKWYYLVYGLYHAALLSGFDAFSRWNKTHKRWGSGPAWQALGVLVTFHAISFGLLIFSGHLDARTSASRDALVDPAGIAAAHDFEGTLDEAGCERISGWGWNRNQPDEAIHIDLYDGDRLIASVPADLMRQDLFAAGRGDGNHGFTLPTPQVLRDGKPHQLIARFGNSPHELAKGRRTILCQ